MEGLPLDVIVVLASGILGTVFLMLWISRRQASNNQGERETRTDEASMGRLHRHPGGECPICLSVEVDNPVQTNCGHWFCASCILGYYDGLGRVAIKCPLCRQQITMLHGAAEDNIQAASAGPATAAAAAAAAETAAGDEADADRDAPPAAAAAAARGVAASAPGAAGLPTDTQERIARFNDRNTRRRRSPWQVIEDAPLLLRRLWADLRRGDTRIFAELIRRGVQLQLVMTALYILSPVDILPEGLLGIAGLFDDLVVTTILLLHITTVYRTILLAWGRSRAAHVAAGSAPAPAPEPEIETVAAAAAAAAGAGAGAPQPPTAESLDSQVSPSSGAPPADGSEVRSPMGAGLAALFAVAAGAIATFVGASPGVAALAALAGGAAAAAAVASSPNAREIPPLTGDW